MDTLLSSPYWPFAILVLAIAAVVLMISVLRFHPFVALIIAAVFVGVISPDLPIDSVHKIVGAVELPMIELGVMAGKIAWVIALAAIIGTAMMQSGAAERIVNALLAALGEKNAAWALLISGFILSIPVFFDTVFFLLIPLAIALGVKTGKNFVLYVAAISIGGAITHTLVPPTPGPLIMAEELKIDLGITIIGGLVACILPALIALSVGRRMNVRLDIPIRVLGDNDSSNNEKEGLKSEPSLFLSLLPVLIPILLISLASVVKVMRGTPPAVIDFLGNKNVAMALGTAIALWLWAKQRGLSKQALWDKIGTPLQVAGVIILITSAGGAFGAMIKHSGIGDAIEYATAGSNFSYILLAWFIAAIMKTAQGSSTVAMITTASIMVALIGTGPDLPYHPIYILLAIGFGSLFISWMNDSGFWVVSKMSGFTEKEALQTWTVWLAVIALVGLVQVLIMSMVLPLR